MRQIILKAWSLLLILNVLSVKLPNVMASHESRTIKEMHNRSEQIDSVKTVATEQYKNFDSLGPLYNAQSNVRIKRSDAGRDKVTSTQTKKVKSKRRRRTFFVPVICG